MNATHDRAASNVSLIFSIGDSLWGWTPSSPEAAAADGAF
jgi:hypothetical protein